MRVRSHGGWRGLRKVKPRRCGRAVKRVRKSGVRRRPDPPLPLPARSREHTARGGARSGRRGEVTNGARAARHEGRAHLRGEGSVRLPAVNLNDILEDIHTPARSRRKPQDGRLGVVVRRSVQVQGGGRRANQRRCARRVWSLLKSVQQRFEEAAVVQRAAWRRQRLACAGILLVEVECRARRACAPECRPLRTRA